MLKDFFPIGSTARPQQIEALNKIEKIWNNGKKFAIGVLPTGSGKSHIAKTVGQSSREIDQQLKDMILSYDIYRRNSSGEYVCEKQFEEAEHFGSFILTVTKALQEQYQTIFPDGVSIKGKNNYQCEIADDFTAEFAPCTMSPEQKSRCFAEDICPYYKNRNQGLASQSPYLNYSVFFNLPEWLQKREILILDEAAELESELVNRYTISLNYKNLKFDGVTCEPLKSHKTDDARSWLSIIKKELCDIADDLQSEVDKQYKKNGFDGIKHQIVQKLNKINSQILAIDESLIFWKEAEFLVEKIDDFGVSFAPYNIKPMASLIFQRAKRVLMMSATISDVNEYARSLGISKNEYQYFEVDSTFPPKKSPIICSKKFPLSFKTMNEILPKIVEASIRICDKHANEKGLIHTHSFKITEAFKEFVGDNSRYLFRGDGAKNEDIMRHHFESSEPTILVSPSMATGISLNDDKGRFQIITKAPYLPLGSARIKKMFEEHPKRYAMLMMDMIIQMSGRCTRSESDYSITYILDGTAVKAIERERYHLPKHFLNRFI